MESKEEFYKSFIDIQKQGGQGLSGIVRVMGDKSANINRWIDELIEEGLMKACETGGSLGHPESNIFYMPTKGYNVWEDEGTDGQYSRHKGRYLQFVRFYLGALTVEHEEGASDTKRALNPAMMDVIRNTEAIGMYAEWLKRNEEALEEMLNLDDFYKSPVVTFTPDEVSWIKGREWFTDNKSISDCIKGNKEGSEDDLKEIDINKQLISLYKRSIELGDKKHVGDLTKSEESIEKCKKDILTRKKVNSWFESQDKKSKIQETFNF
jgi:hypothetical protein